MGKKYSIVLRMLMALLLSLSCSTTDSSTLKPTGSPHADTGEHSGGDSGSTPPDDTGTTLPTCEDCTPSETSVSLTIDPELLISDPSTTVNNPLKGFMTSYLWGAPANDFPDQMEFLYLPMSDLWSASGDTLSTGLEPLLVAAAERNHHAVLRVYIDYPTRPSGLPTHLEGIVPCSTYTDHGGGCSPDYDHPDLVDAMLGLIAALGAQYDGDTRLGLVQVGLLGFWGEWHTWPHAEWFPSDATQTAVLSAFDTAFEITQLQARRIAANVLDLRIGFHDDSFAYSTLGDVGWYFLPGLVSGGGADRWQSVPIGGEVRPELQSSVFSDEYVLGPLAQDINDCIDQTHASYLLNYYAFNGSGTGYLGVDRDRAELAALQMGYQFELTAASVSVTGLLNETIDLTVDFDLSQTGVAPFYYPLFIAVDSPELETTVVSDIDLSSIQPGDNQMVSLSLGRVSATVLNGPITVTLKSPILQAGQAIALATTTPWPTSDSSTQLRWDLGCDDAGVSYSIGHVIGSTAEGCDCVCDVDSTFRTCHGEPCSY